MKKVLTLLCLAVFSLSSCVAYKRDTTYFGAVGLDADSIILPGQLEMRNVNMSRSFGAATKLVQQMWNAYLVQQGLQFLGGKYYDLKGQEVNSAQSIKLEELRNAKSLEDGKLKLEALKLTQEAPAATPAPTAGA
jgi:hypothetical protein